MQQRADMTNNLPKARELFLHAVGKLPPEQWNAYVAEVCGADADLAQTVRDLLQVHREAGSFLEAPAPGLDATVNQLPAERIGTTIGPYKLLQQIGEGGMGVVYMAEQTEPVERRVALKIIKPGMDSRQVVARFEAERQALAMMDHPNIAKVFEAGCVGVPALAGSVGVPALAGPPAIDDRLKAELQLGRPYFVMELVKGTPITKYCDEKRLSLKARLELLIPVCQAIQHAHQKGIIHRDIKPNNVLVALYDGKPVPKVIDFGVAKATAQKLTERTMFTELGQIIGTLEYMSPEQAELNQLDIDTRSDIYSLGVLLYELLTGATPFEKQKLRAAAFHEMLRIIREDEPPRPSTNLSTSGTLPSIAANRSIEPARLSKTVRGELDWIVMKALEKDRSRRYETANGLASDIQRYLNDEHVQACPPSAMYRFRKIVRRNKGSVLAAAVVFTTLLVGIVGTTWGMLSAQSARKVAVAEKAKAVAAALAETEAKKAALAMEAETQAVLDFVQSRVFAAARPLRQEGGLGSDVTLRRALVASLPSIPQKFREQPRVEIRLRNTLGLTFQYLGEMKIAADQFAAARELSARQNSPDHAETLAAADNLATCYRFLGRNIEALELHQETYKLKKGTLGPDHISTLGCLVNLASDFFATGEPDKSAELFESALAMLQAKHPEHAFTLNCRMNLANNYDTLGQLDKALEQREETLRLLQEKRGRHHPDTLGGMSNLAISYAAVGRHEQALKLDEQTLMLRRTILGRDHPETLDSMNHVGVDYQNLNQPAKAIELLKETLGLKQDKLGKDHPATLACMVNLAVSYGAVGQADDAIELLEEKLALQKRKLKPDHPHTIESQSDLAVTYHEFGRHADAFKLEEEALRLVHDKYGRAHPDYLSWLKHMAWMYASCPDERYRNPDRAIELIQEAMELAPTDAGVWNALAAAQYHAWDYQAALASLEKSIELSEGGVGFDWFLLAMCEWQIGDKAQARELYERGANWIIEHDSEIDELLLLQAEAAELLGIKFEPKRNQNPTPKPNRD